MTSDIRERNARCTCGSSSCIESSEFKDFDIVSKTNPGVSTETGEPHGAFTAVLFPDDPAKPGIVHGAAIGAYYNVRTLEDALRILRAFCGDEPDAEVEFAVKVISGELVLLLRPDSDLCGDGWIAIYPSESNADEVW